MVVNAAGRINAIVRKEVNDIYDSLEIFRQSVQFPSFQTVNIPMVLVLGNHSAGKSTFLNYIMQKNVQRTGRAPTDSTFTVLAGGTREEVLDGFALCQSNKYGFEHLDSLFGREFVAQMELKTVVDSAFFQESEVLLVDSPGMIDQPGDSRHRGQEHDRGYDFKQVIRWFAGRADIILLMFDPDKPGTTFETLDVLTSCLHDSSSKLSIIMNKVDDFKTVHDFSRAYGALCWNLSKMIPRKDMPFIYTMYVPTENNMDSTKIPVLRQLLTDEFDGVRDEVVREVTRAPDRATDNIVNIVKQTLLRLEMHCTVLEECRKRYRIQQLMCYGATIGIGIVGVTATIAYIIRHVSLPPTSEPPASTANAAAWQQKWETRTAKSRSSFRWRVFLKLVGLSSVSILSAYQSSIVYLRHQQKTIISWLPELFQHKYRQGLCDSERSRDELLFRWKMTQPGIAIALDTILLHDLPIFTISQSTILRTHLELNIPRLYRCIRDRESSEHSSLSMKHGYHPSLT